MTSADSRAARISEIFGLLDDGPAADHDRQIGLCREALALMTPEEVVGPAAGWLQFVAGKAFVKRAGTDRVADLTSAIDLFQAALAVWTPEGQSVNWVAAQTNLSFAYSDRHALTGSLEDEQGALGALGVALRLVDPQRDPVLWARLANNLGVIQLQRTSGDRAQILEEAINCLEAAAQLRERHGARAEWARTQANLGVAYRERVEGDRSTNLERALACLDAALQPFGDDGDPVERARILLQRARTLGSRVAGTWAANADLAYADARRASELVAPARDRLTWAEVQAELAAALRRRTAGSRAENLEEAIACYRRALDCFDPATSPLRWALLSTQLGGTLAERIRGQRVTNVEEALEHLTGAAAALRALPAAAALYAGALATLGQLYLHRRRGDAEVNAETAWRYLSEARDLEERLRMPARTRAAVLNRLGNASMARQRDDRGQHVEDAIACYELGRELAGPEDGKLQAHLLNNLAAAFAQRPRGDRAGNIVRSLELYEQLNSFRTREMSPLEWAEARSNIASVLASSVLPGWLPAAPAPPDLGDLEALGQPDDEIRLDKAVEAFRDALSVLTESGPAASVITVGLNLGYLGTLASRWRNAVDGYQAALDAFGARYRESLQPEARYDELSDVAGLTAELAAALASQAGDAAEADAEGTLLRRAAAALENGRMQLIGDLMERDQAALAKLQSVREELYEAYQAASQRLREQDSAEWAQFQLR